MRCWLLVLLVSLVGCIGAPPPPLGDDDSGSAIGLVSEPAHGAVVTGDPVGLSLHVAGVYDGGSATLSIQVLADPDDLTSWQSIATVEPDPGSHGFAADVRPVASDAERARWPAGGVLRLRVVDEDGVALARDPSVPEATVIAVVNPAAPPPTWTYLSEQPVGSVAETQAYYAAIDAPATLDEFQTRFGFPAGEVAATYYNAGDLGIGREMHCRATETPAGGLACYVRNYGTFGGDRDQAITELVAGGTPLATVAMVYAPPIDAPNAVQFVVFGPDGARIDAAQLDTHGDNTSIPQNCLNCHGSTSRYEASTHTVDGARFLGFDPAAFEFADQPGFDLAAQQDGLRGLNRLIADTAPTAAAREMIDGMFPAADAPYDPAFVPAAWAAPADARVYREVIAPYCRSCHVSFARSADDPATLATPDQLRAYGAATVLKVCGPGPRGMPTAEATAVRMYNSSARALLLAWLDAPGACAPAP